MVAKAEGAEDRDATSQAPPKSLMVAEVAQGERRQRRRRWQHKRSGHLDQNACWVSARACSVPPREWVGIISGAEAKNRLGAIAAA